MPEPRTDVEEVSDLSEALRNWSASMEAPLPIIAFALTRVLAEAIVTDSRGMLGPFLNKTDTIYKLLCTELNHALEEYHR